MPHPVLGSKGQTSATGGMVLTVIMVALVLGVMITTLEDSLSLNSEGEEVFGTIASLAWVAMLILGVGMVAFVGKWIIGIFG